MKKLWFTAVAAALVLPALAGAQIERTGTGKQKAWLVSNFRSGISECAVLRDGEGFSVSGAATLAFIDRDSDDDGYDFSVADTGGVPTIAAHAINTKGTGATNSGRSNGQTCGLMPSPRGTIPAGRVGAVAGITGGAVAGIVVAKCSVSGDPDAPRATFTVPLSSFGGAAKTYVGHVTLIKREPGTALIAQWLSKKGYDSYQAKSDMGRTAASEGIEMTVVASCDTSGLVAKGGKPVAASYDLAVGKKV